MSDHIENINILIPTLSARVSISDEHYNKNNNNVLTVANMNSCRQMLHL